MKSLLIKIPIWMLIAWPYVFFLGMLFPSDSFLRVYVVLTLILCVVNIVNACTYQSTHPVRELSLWGMIIKLVHMPFNVMVLLFGIMVVASAIMAPETFLVPSILLFLVVGLFLFMITSSAYCAKTAMMAKEQGIIKRENAMMLSMCSFILIADVICSIIIYNTIKKNKRK